MPMELNSVVVKDPASIQRKYQKVRRPENIAKSTQILAGIIASQGKAPQSKMSLDEHYAKLLENTSAKSSTRNLDSSPIPPKKRRFGGNGFTQPSSTVASAADIVSQMNIEDNLSKYSGR